MDRIARHITTRRFHRAAFWPWRARRPFFFAPQKFSRILLRPLYIAMNHCYTIGNSCFASEQTSPINHPKNGPPFFVPFPGRMTLVLWFFTRAGSWPGTPEEKNRMAKPPALTTGRSSLLIFQSTHHGESICSLRIAS